VRPCAVRAMAAERCYLESITRPGAATRAPRSAGPVVTCCTANGSDASRSPQVMRVRKLRIAHDHAGGDGYGGRSPRRGQPRNYWPPGETARKTPPSETTLELTAQEALIARLARERALQPRDRRPAIHQSRATVKYHLAQGPS